MVNAFSKKSKIYSKKKKNYLYKLYKINQKIFFSIEKLIKLNFLNLKKK